MIYDKLAHGIGHKQRANDRPSYDMPCDAAPQDAGWKDQGVNVHTAKPKVNDTPIAEPRQNQEGFDPMPEDFARGRDEGPDYYSKNW